MQMEVYEDPDCLTRSQVKKLTRVVPSGAIIPSDKIKITTTPEFNSIANDRSSNAIIIEWTPTTTMSKSSKGSLKLTMPVWFVSDSTPPLHFITDADTRKCKSDAMSITGDNMESNTLVIKYEYMRAEFLSGQPIKVECRGFRNPLVPEVQSGYSFMTKDENDKMIESIDDLTLDATAYTPYKMRQPQSMNVQPSNSVISSVEEWGIDVSAFFPLVKDCYLELVLPDDLISDVTEV